MFHDAWLPRHESGRVVSPCRDMNQELTLDHFLDPVKCEWRIDKVYSAFLPFEATKIISIPLKACDEEDELCWSYSKDGILQVNDVYDLAIKSSEDASCSRGPDPVWKRLWKLNVLPKVRDFA
ncbi:unnamed protein product [Amaranthus hypochondriacus]